MMRWAFTVQQCWIPLSSYHFPNCWQFVVCMQCAENSFWWIFCHHRYMLKFFIVTSFSLTSLYWRWLSTARLKNFKTKTGTVWRSVYQKTLMKFYILKRQCFIADDVSDTRVSNKLISFVMFTSQHLHRISADCCWDLLFIKCVCSFLL